MALFAAISIGLLWMVAISALLIISATQFSDQNYLWGFITAFACLMITAGGITIIVNMVDDSDKVCVKDHVVFINNAPYTVCDQYATRVDQ